MNARRLTLATVILAILVLAAIAVIPRLGPRKAPSTTPSGTTVLTYQDQPAIGAADAPVKLALFEDFLCPHCAEFSDQVWPQIKRDYVDTGKVRAYFFYFPVIDQVQSRVVGGLAQCVYFQSNDAFWSLEPILMRAQQQLGNTPRAIDIAAQYAPGLDKQKLQQCVDNGAGAKAVDRDNGVARSLGLQGTPTVVVDGSILQNADWNTVKSAIDGALTRASGGS